jgi:hypothetical protein
MPTATCIVVAVVIVAVPQLAPRGDPQVTSTDPARALRAIEVELRAIERESPRSILELVIHH